MKKREYSFIITVLLIICFLLAVNFLYIKTTKRQLEADSFEYLKEVTSQTSNSLNMKIENDMATIKNLASLLKSKNDLTDAETEKYFSIYSKSNNFSYLGISDLNGNTRMSTNKEMDVTTLLSFKKALHGETVVSKIHDFTLGKDMILYETPIIDNTNNAKETIGVLFATIEVDSLDKYINISIFEKRIKAFIIDKNGDFVLGSNDEKISPIEKAVMSSIKIGRVDGVFADEQGFIDNLAFNKSGVVSYLPLKGNDKMFVTYAPIKANGWYMFMVIDPTYIAPKAQAEQTYFFYTLLAFDLFVFVIFILSMYFQKKKVLDMQKVRNVDDVTGGKTFEAIKQEHEAIKRKYPSLAVGAVVFDIKHSQIVDDRTIFSNENIFKRVYGLLTESLSGLNTLCRLDDNNFLLLSYFEDKESAQEGIYKIEEQILNLISNNLILHCGIYIVDSIQDDTLVAIKNKALIAKNESQKPHQGPIYFFSKKTEEELLRENKIEQEMYTALENKEFVLYLQPKYNAIKKTFYGAEALVRWKHKERGILPPFEYIPIFERNGFIKFIDMSILEQVCTEINKWISEGKEPIAISVNLSRITIQDKDIVEKLINIVKDKNVSPSLIEFEITESVLMDDAEKIIEVITKLHEEGFKVSIDDFGTGYSSINMLHTLSIDAIKLDKSFVLEKNNKDKLSKVIKGVMSLAKELDIETVVEGVETGEICVNLEGVGCYLMQGYYFSRPIPAEEFKSKYILEN